MWYAIALVYFNGLLTLLFSKLEEKAKEGTKKKDVYSVLFMVFLWLAILSLLGIILYVVGIVWYYLGGWLVVDCSDGFWEYVINGFMSLMPLVFISGLIMIICGWNPDK